MEVELVEELDELRLVLDEDVEDSEVVARVTVVLGVVVVPVNPSTLKNTSPSAPEPRMTPRETSPLLPWRSLVGIVVPSGTPIRCGAPLT